MNQYTLDSKSNCKLLSKKNLVKQSESLWETFTNSDKYWLLFTTYSILIEFYKTCENSCFEKNTSNIYKSVNTRSCIFQRIETGEALQAWRLLKKIRELEWAFSVTKEVYLTSKYAEKDAWVSVGALYSYSRFHNKVNVRGQTARLLKCRIQGVVFGKTNYTTQFPKISNTVGVLNIYRLQSKTYWPHLSPSSWVAILWA